MNLKSNKAITLVALIITIIILLILAGVSLSMVLGENGLINKAQSSVNKYKESSENEQKLLNSIENYMDLQLKLPGEKVELPDGWNKDTVDAVLDDKKNVIPVPKNFYYVGGNLDNGVIISDNSADAYDGKVDKTTWEYTTSLVGNQFVWIPCTEEEYSKPEFGISEIWNYFDLIQNEIDKIKKYNGFYVARYEAGLDEDITPYSKVSNSNSKFYNVEGVPQSKAGKDPWIFITYQQSRANAIKWYSASDTVESTLITGREWEVMLNKFIGTTNTNGIVFNKQDLEKSTRWGNYYDTNLQYSGRTAVLDSSKGIIEPITRNPIVGMTGRNKMIEYSTGASKIAESYHIYDIAGNLYEYTEESSDKHSQRGSSCTFSTESGAGATERENGYYDIGEYRTGFRVVLYIK